MNLIALALSLLLHAAVVGLALYQPKLENQPKGPPPPLLANMVTDADLIDKIEERVDSNALHIECPQTYRGIGIKRNFGGEVIHVAKGWPADRAGIRVGDILEPWGFEEVDGFMEFEVIRGSKRVRMRLKTEAICFRESPY
jgi:hypothetical protein